MWPTVGISGESSPIHAKFVLSQSPVSFACTPVHMLARDGVQIGTAQYARSYVTPCDSSRSSAGSSTPSGSSMRASHWSMHRTSRLGRSSPLRLPLATRIPPPQVRPALETRRDPYPPHPPCPGGAGTARLVSRSGLPPPG